jgi:protease YdgD
MLRRSLAWGKQMPIGRRGVALVLFSVSLAACAAPSWAGTSPPPRGDIVEAQAYPWSAIGKLNNGAGGSCTAVMVSNKFALTAAHCLFFRSTRRFLPAQSFHLVFGYENQDFREHFRVSAYYIPPRYDAAKPYESLAHDWALLRLSGRAQTPSLPIRDSKSRAAAGRLMTAGYSHFQPYVMTADRDCRFIGRSRDKRFLFDSCHAPAGFSGAPLLAAGARAGSFSLAGIHVANQLWRAQTVAIAIPMESIWPEIKPCIRDEKCRFQFTATGRDPTAEELLSGLPNVVGSIKKPADVSAGSPCVFDGPDCRTELTGP